MRLHVLYDGEGRIVAAAPSDVADGELVVRPVATEPGHEAGELEVPSELEGAALADICERSRVDVAQRRMVVRDATAG
ncbi:hypothetical protein [Nocardioides sp. InS609-2]|uniref:hypothetical protein n=1 Tax=Nocardioides sp. InS609-2 TaxID=2760705 RepID=UPI0020C07A72|nr:hypothetical protein [Nocardioides sp. InS609-2]